MILDLKTIHEAPVLSCDLCLVGAGAAGLAIASEMMGTPLRVVLIESGGLDHEPATQALYEAEISGLPHPGTTQGRFRVCGGSTTKWGGQALPLMPSDFERRDWVSHSGWPITFDELSPYYKRACRFLLVDEMNFDTDLFAHLRTRPPEFDPQRVWYHFSKWSPQPSVREHYLPGIGNSDRCTLLLHANLTDIVLEDGFNRVGAVQVRSLEGQTATVRARTFVLCAGGIETARLLLSSNRQKPSGIGNEHDLVGRFFQDHPNAMVGWLKTRNPERIQRLFNVFHKQKLKYSVRCTAAPQWQRDHRTLNTSMGIMFVQDSSGLQDLKDIYTSLRDQRFSKEVFRKLLRAAGRPSEAVLPIWHYLARGRSFAPGARLQVCLTCEQEPNPESRIMLSDKTDALGIPRANVRWKLTELTRYSMRQFAAVLGDEFRRVGLGEFELDPWFRDDSSGWTDHICDQFHHMGTARMNDSPREGVVDRDCRVHGISNLYIGSSAVFPTSGHSNPTLTIIALCLRLADRLKLELA
jgi:choline dehydrogenase-like flavoprotein